MHISEKVTRVIESEHISATELAYMIRHAAISSIRSCNWKYFHWCFQVVGDQLLDMQRVKMMELGRGPHRVVEEHEKCLGEGCHQCGWVGSIVRYISDPTELAMDTAKEVERTPYTRW